ncbi:methyltransferase domain-containing protein [Apiospora phragmitis]|uniref:Methyltransferase domain-containing protein n=1 Tax=Apiospora phragmitis TaxID=2905665 RepID=A0ABR1VDE8_9PEZI
MEPRKTPECNSHSSRKTPVNEPWPTTTARTGTARSVKQKPLLDPPTTSPPETTATATTSIQLEHTRHGVSNETLASSRRPANDLQIVIVDSAGSEVNAAASHLWPQVDSDDSGDGGDSRAEQPSGTSTSPKLFRSFRSKFKKQLHKCLQHNVSKDIHDGRLHLAPVTAAKRVLDIGTGRGIWAFDFAKQNPESTVLGIDIRPVEAPHKEPNCSFQVGDAEEEWQVSGKFDFIYARAPGYEFASTPRYLESAYAHLNPGGFAEFQEWIIRIRSPNHSLDGTALQRWSRLMYHGAGKAGRRLDFINGYAPLLTKAGFVNVTERRYPVPLVPWAPGKKLQKIGEMMRQNLSWVLPSLSDDVFTARLNWQKGELDTFLDTVRSELGNNKIHCYLVL